jgi:hypothetical protein
MLAALKHELDVARRLTSGENLTSLEGGSRLRRDGDSFVYHFDQMTGFPPDEGAQISMTVGTETGKGRYLGEVKDSFAFLVDKDFGTSVEQCTVTSDPLFLIEQQIELLKKDMFFGSAVALASIGMAEMPPVSPLALNADFVSGLNPLQSDALRIAATSSVTYIWGPPGTGKTVTMGSLVAALASLGQKVLLVSNTNLAVDTALEQCLDRYTAATTLTDGVMLRLGEMVKGELVERYSDHIELGRVVERATEPLRRELEQASQLLQVVQDGLSDLRVNEAEYQTHLAASASPKPTFDRHSSLTAQSRNLKEEIPRIEAKIRSLETELEEINALNGLSRVLRRRRKSDVVRAEINTTQRRKSSVDELALKLVPEIATLQREIEDLEQRARVSNDWLERHPEASKIAASIVEQLKEESRLKQLIHSIQEAIAGTRTRILSEARVVACTAYKPLSDPDVAKMSFDCVVVDEASMMTLPLYFCSAALARKRLVIAGDFRQLRPIVRMKRPKDADKTLQATNERRYHDLLISNPFTKSGVIARLGLGVDVPGLVALRDQYRMRGEISDLISTVFYPEHTLRAAGMHPVKTTPWGDSPFILFDTAALRPESSPVNRKSQRNTVHAIVVEAIAQQLIEDGWELSATAEKSFGVVSPYTKQSQLIERLLSQGTGHRIGSGVSTVHRFQGNERDLMIIDLTKVASEGDSNLGPFIGHSDPMDPANSMWNVAISRARRHVIVVADSGSLALNGTSVIARLIDAMGPNLLTIDASTLLLRSEDSTGDNELVRQRGSLAWFTGASFYNAFEIDLRGATSKVVIASPFTARSATDRWLPLLEDLNARNVEVTILTKPLREKANEVDSTELHSQLERVAGELRFVEKMHEKLAIIDGRVSWLGSLNILSHHSASEIMMRIESSEFAQSLLKEYERPALQKKKGPNSSNLSTQVQAGSPCPLDGCKGTMSLVPSGFSKKTGKPYGAFLGCTKFQSHPK